MNTKNAIMTTTLSVIAVLAITSVTELNNAFAEEDSGYKFADGIHPVFTFIFKDGTETFEFPVYNMSDDYVANEGSPSFSVEGVVGSAPHLHKALDEAFKYKANPSYEWNYQLFDVNIDFVKDNETLRTMDYHDCYVDDYKVKTLTDAYESYMSSKSGFAIIDDVDFTCGGLNQHTESANISWETPYSVTEYPSTPYDFAEDVRTFITFEFDQGVEKVEFPIFDLTSGFAESSDNVIPGFSVEGTLQKHPLLDMAVNNARVVSGFANGNNVDFEATVEFTNGDGDVLRTLSYRDCRVTGSEIKTQSDKEEGFTGKSGFASVEQIDFECIGLTADHSDLKSNLPSWSSVKLENTLPLHQYPLGTGPMAIATFTYDHGIETISFPIFDQGDVLVKSNPTFALKGIVGDFPMLYSHVDENLAMTSVTGTNPVLHLFDVDVNLVYGDDVVRGFNYVDCRVTDYTVNTQTNKEETYFKGFALSNTYDFECQGYHPNNPPYDALFVKDSAKNVSTNDLRNTDQWGPGFYKQ